MCELQEKIDRLTAGMQWLMSGGNIATQEQGDAASLTGQHIYTFQGPYPEGKGKGGDAKK